jgi:hypothetical protein
VQLKLVHVIACASAVTGCASSPSSWIQCSVIAPSSTSVAQREGIGSAPAPAGGTIAPGIYDLTSTTLYDGGVSRMPYAAARAYVFGESHFEAASGGTTIAGTWSTSGTTLDRSRYCAREWPKFPKFPPTAGLESEIVGADGRPAFPPS